MWVVISVVRVVSKSKVAIERNRPPNGPERWQSNSSRHLQVRVLVSVVRKLMAFVPGVTLRTLRHISPFPFWRA